MIKIFLKFLILHENVHLFKLVQSGEDIVKYTTACSDNIPCLEMFKATCMPIFLIIALGNIVDFIHGADGKKMKEVNFHGVEQKEEVIIA